MWISVIATGERNESVKIQIRVTGIRIQHVATSCRSTSFLAIATAASLRYSALRRP
jgi:hypothetical protein